jgi:hypothetical protein
MHPKPDDEKRSSHWPAVRAAHLKDHPGCAVCGDTKHVNVHHIHPFHLHPQLELDPENLITLCEDEHYVNCHLFIGHLGNFHGYNPAVIADAAEWRKKMLDNQARIHETAK